MTISTTQMGNILIDTILAGNLLRIYNCICQWYGTENLVQRSIRICMSFSHRSANSVTTTEKCEVLGAYLTRN